MTGSTRSLSASKIANFSLKLRAARCRRPAVFRARMPEISGYCEDEFFMGTKLDFLQRVFNASPCAEAQPIDRKIVSAENVSESRQIDHSMLQKCLYPRQVL